MGFNTTVVILNDTLHHIEEDPNFGRKLVEAIKGFRRDDRNLVNARTASGSISVGAAQIVSVEHADHSSLILVGGNCATVVDHYACGFNHDEEKAQLVALQAWADKMGFNLTRKRKKTT